MLIALARATVETGVATGAGAGQAQERSFLPLCRRRGCDAREIYAVPSKSAVLKAALAEGRLVVSGEWAYRTQLDIFVHNTGCSDGEVSDHGVLGSLTVSSCPFSSILIARALP